MSETSGSLRTSRRRRRVSGFLIRISWPSSSPSRSRERSSLVIAGNRRFPACSENAERFCHVCSRAEPAHGSFLPVRCSGARAERASRGSGQRSRLVICSRAKPARMVRRASGPSLLTRTRSQRSGSLLSFARPRSLTRTPGLSSRSVRPAVLLEAAGGKYRSLDPGGTLRPLRSLASICLRPPPRLRPTPRPRRPGRPRRTTTARSRRRS
jgi:hypothetical protein